MVEINMNEALAARCRWARERRGLSQKELAAEAGVSKGLIGNIEAGRNASLRKLTEVARELGVNPVWLAEGRGQPDLDIADLAEKEMAMHWLAVWRDADPATRSLIDSTFAVAARQQQPAQAEQRRA